MKNRNPMVVLLIVAVVAVVLSLLVGGVAIKAADWIPKCPECYTASATVLLAIATVILAVITGALAWSALLEFKEAQRIHRFDFLFHLDEAISTPHNIDIANRVIKHESYGSITSIEEWNDLRRYMGIFERIQFLIDVEMVDIDHVSDIYFSKMERIVNHNEIYNRILKDSNGWQRFHKLWCALVEHRRKKGEKTRDLNNFAKLPSSLAEKQQEMGASLAMAYPWPNNPVKRTAHSAGSVFMRSSVPVGLRSPGERGS